MNVVISILSLLIKLMILISLVEIRLRSIYRLYPIIIIQGSILRCCVVMRALRCWIRSLVGELNLTMVLVFIFVRRLVKTVISCVVVLMRFWRWNLLF